RRILINVDIPAGDERSTHGLTKIGVAAEVDEVDALVRGSAVVPGVTPAIGPVLGDRTQRPAHADDGAAGKEIVLDGLIVGRDLSLVKSVYKMIAVIPRVAVL